MVGGVAVGIDLGSSNSVSRFNLNEQNDLLPVSAGDHRLPSVVEYRRQFTVGEAVKHCIQQFGRSALPDKDSPQYRRKHRKLMQLCEEARITLSTAPATEISMIVFLIHIHYWYKLVFSPQEDYHDNPLFEK